MERYVNPGINTNQNLTGLTIIAVTPMVIINVRLGVMLVKIRGSSAMYHACQSGLVSLFIVNCNLHYSAE